MKRAFWKEGVSSWNFFLPPQHFEGVTGFKGACKQWKERNTPQEKMVCHIEILFSRHNTLRVSRFWRVRVYDETSPMYWRHNTLRVSRFLRVRVSDEKSVIHRRKRVLYVMKRALWKVVKLEERWRSNVFSRHNTFEGVWQFCTGDFVWWKEPCVLRERALYLKSVRVWSKEPCICGKEASVERAVEKERVPSSPAFLAGKSFHHI